MSKHLTIFYHIQDKYLPVLIPVAVILNLDNPLSIYIPLQTITLLDVGNFTKYFENSERVCPSLGDGGVGEGKEGLVQVLSFTCRTLHYFPKKRKS